MMQVIGLILTFALIIILSWKRVSTAKSLLAGSILLAILSGISVQRFATLVLTTAFDPQTINLATIVAAIGILGYCMRQTRLIDELVSGLRSILPGRVLIGVIPAIVGLLPIPGGALFSAPLIEEEANRLHLNAEEKTVANIVYRHIWFYILPLSSPLILAAEIAQINLYELIVIQIPIFFVALGLGYAMVTRRIARTREASRRGSPRTAVAGLAPILIAVLLNVLGLPLAISVTLGVLATLVIKRAGARESAKMLWRGIPWTLVQSILAVMILLSTIKDSAVVSMLLDITVNAKIPPILFATLVPFMMGSISGLPIAGIGLSLPLALSLTGASAPPVVSLVVLSTYAGYYLSPLHLCLVLSNQYFQSRIQRVYKTWIPYVLGVCGFGIAVDYYLLSWG